MLLFLLLIISNFLSIFLLIIIFSIINVDVNLIIAIEVENLLSSLVMIVDLEYLIKINCDWGCQMVVLCLSGLVLLEFLMERLAVSEFIHQPLEVSFSLMNLIVPL